MTRTITQRELRNESAAVMDAVEGGETIVVTRNGRPVAELRPIRARRSVPLDEIREQFALLPRMSYTEMRADIEEFFGDDDRIRDEDYE
ncbi:type II toxin-antitoxin system Phd/YefM family antitoxin [Actinospica robiniae]|uniref:type II toxin-antitoxin system Phd/YefM family antitoxin n=1 Tax=Actinospica robiniae TaxID=304901 RepID=UPI0005596873|nr:type II toxin-antitoxin system prevent-host-death family antitoxin [Actinospica robiniae]